MPTINWYPGHIAKAERKLKELAALVDVVVVVIDARIPQSSFYANIEKLVGDKPQLMLLNKSDLADPAYTSKWKSAYESYGFDVMVSNCSSNKEVSAIINECCVLGRPVIQKLMAKGRLPRPVRIMVMGMPNVGKSSLINRLVKNTKTKVGPKAGVTKGMQWVRINPKIELLDTPGIIPMKLDDQLRALNLAVVNSIGESAYDPIEVAQELLSLLWQQYPDQLKAYYKIMSLEVCPTLEDIASSRNLITTGSSLDLLRSAHRVLADFRSGKIGRFTLEQDAKFKVTPTNNI